MAKRELIEVIDGIEYYYNLETFQYEWRVPDIREAIEAEEGYTILSADYSQIEVKIMAYLSGDETFIYAINEGKDIHSYIATEIYGKRKEFTYDFINIARKDESHPRHHELNSLRSKIKAVVFGLLYGAGAFNISEQTGMDETEAQEFINEFFAAYPKIKAWIDEQGRNAIKYGFSTTILGRKRFYYIPEPDNRDYDRIISQIRRWAGNQPIQGTNADVLKLAMSLIFEELKKKGYGYDDARILFVVHDEIVMTCRIEIKNEVRTIMEDSMNTAYDMVINGVKNKIDVGEDKTWKKV